MRGRRLVSCKFVRGLGIVLIVGSAIYLGLGQPGQGQDSYTFDVCHPPLLQTDQKDYTPGTTAYITGCGFLGGETVRLQVSHIDGAPDDGDGHVPWDVIADADGNFRTTWTVCVLTTVSVPALA